MNKNYLRLVFALISLALFFILAWLVISDLTLMDKIISDYIKEIRNPVFNLIFIFLGNYLKIILIVFSLIIIFLMFIEGRRKESGILILVLLLGYFFEQSMKFIFSRVRASEQLVEEIGYSFPSGHSIFSIILFLMIIYFYKDKIKDKSARFIFILLNLLLIMFVGFSRIYINVHYFSDVLGGFLLGYFIVNVIIILMEERKNLRKIKKAKYL
jgi:undecaprenyl-diphosphatase